MNDKHIYQGNVYNHSRHVEIKLQTLSVDVLNKLVCAVMDDSADDADKAAAAVQPLEEDRRCEEADEADLACGESQGYNAGSCVAASSRDAAEGDLPVCTLAQQVEQVIRTLREECLLKHKSDFAWVMWGLNYSLGHMEFRSSRSFAHFLTEDCRLENPPSASVLQRVDHGFTLSRRPDDWKFLDDPTERERQRRINVAKRTMVLMQLVR